MGRTLRTSLFQLVPVLVAGAAGAGEATVVEGFEGGTNRAGWSFLAGADVIELQGGNPGAWLHQRNFDTFAPILSNSSVLPSAFGGDYRARNVTRISFDARTDATTFGNPTGFEMSLLLRDTKGTALVDDDDYAYFVGPEVPQPGQGWKHFDYDVPSASTASVPPGWRGGWVGDPENFRPGIDWNDVITSVDLVEFWWIDPRFFAIFRNWDIGADNIAIELDSVPATVTPRNGRNVNPRTLSSSNVPVLGTVWTSTLDCAGHSPGLAVLVGAAGPSLGPSIDAGQLLIDLAGPIYATLVQLHSSGAVTFDQPMPASTALCGTPASVQGICLGAPGAQLSNALDLILGL